MIVILGGTNAHEMQRHGYLETLLVAGAPDRAARVRNLAWQADTVYRQQRPRAWHHIIYASKWTFVIGTC